MASTQLSNSGNAPPPKCLPWWWSLRGQSREAAKQTADPFDDENNRRVMLGKRPLKRPARSNSEIRRSLEQLIEKAKQI